MYPDSPDTMQTLHIFSGLQEGQQTFCDLAIMDRSAMALMSAGKQSLWYHCGHKSQPYHSMAKNLSSGFESILQMGHLTELIFFVCVSISP